MSDDVPDCRVLKPLLSGSIPVEQFVQALEKVSTALPRRPACSLGLLLKGGAAVYFTSTV